MKSLFASEHNMLLVVCENMKSKVDVFRRDDNAVGGGYKLDRDAKDFTITRIYNTLGIAMCLSILRQYTDTKDVFEFEGEQYKFSSNTLARPMVKHEVFEYGELVVVNGGEQLTNNREIRLTPFETPAREPIGEFVAEMREEQILDMKAITQGFSNRLIANTNWRGNEILDNEA